VIDFSTLLRNPFSFLFAKSRKDERLVEYVLREHRRGRALDDILDDPFVRNRCTEEQRMRLLDHPDVVRALAS
jgi:hypothetical protein